MESSSTPVRAPLQILDTLTVRIDALLMRLVAYSVYGGVLVMVDIILLSVVLVFFVACMGFVVLCERL